MLTLLHLLFSKSNIIAFVVAVAAFVAATTNLLSQKRAIDFSITAFSGIDQCSNDSTFIVLINCGTVSQADSLLLYDITIKYPANKVSFKQALYQNTLSESLETKSSGSRDTGEVRVFGFNVMRFISGSKPLVALLFKHRAECTDSIPIEFAVLPDINPEARLFVRELKGLTVPIATPYVSSRSLKVQFSNDTIVLGANQEIVRIPIEWSISNTEKVRHFSFDVLCYGGLTIDSAIATSGQKISVIVDSSKTSIEVLQNSSAPLLQGTFDIWGHVPTAPGKLAGTLSVNNAKWDTCDCLATFSGNTASYRRDDVSSLETREPTLDVTSDGDVWEIENTTLENVHCAIYNVQGSEVFSVLLHSGNKQNIVTNSWPRGIYMIVLMSRGSCVKTKKVCK